MKDALPPSIHTRAVRVSPASGSRSLQGLGYLLEQFPKATQTFIVHEIEALRALAGPFPIVSVRRPEGEPTQDYDPALVEGVHYLPKDPRVPKKDRRWHEMLEAYRKHPEQRRMHEMILVAEWLSQRRVRHVHCHFAGLAARTALMMKRLFGISYSLTVHANDVLLPGAKPPLSVDDILGEAVFVVTETDFMAKVLRRRYPALKRRFHRVHNGISLPPLPARIPAVSRRTPRIAAVGRYVEKKGFADLIRACAALGNLDFRCSIIGFGPLESALEKRIAGLGLTGRVELTGPRTQSQILTALQDADVFVLPSVRERKGGMDNLPTAIIEAMAMGLPVISTPVAGIPELVIDGETGLLVPERNPEKLASALRTLLSDPARARQMGAAGRRHAEANFDRRETTRALLRLLEGALEVRRSSARASGAR